MVHFRTFDTVDLHCEGDKQFQGVFFFSQRDLFVQIISHSEFSSFFQIETQHIKAKSEEKKSKTIISATKTVIAHRAPPKDN